MNSARKKYLENERRKAIWKGIFEWLNMIIGAIIVVAFSWFLLVMVLSL